MTLNPPSPKSGRRFMDAHQLSLELKVHVETVYRRLIAAGIIQRDAPRKFTILPRGASIARHRLNAHGYPVLQFDFDEVREYVVQMRRYRG